MKMVHRCFERYFLWWHLGISVAASALLAAWVLIGDGGAALDLVLSGNRGAIYGTLASIFGALLGFVIAAIAIVLGYAPSEQFAFIRKQRFYQDLWKIFIRSMEALGFATLTAFAALLCDRDSSPCHLIQIAVLFGAVWATLSLSRVIWAIKQVVTLVTRDRE